jgi:hypothetical protein
MTWALEAIPTVVGQTLMEWSKSKEMKRERVQVFGSYRQFRGMPLKLLQLQNGNAVELQLE